MQLVIRYKDYYVATFLPWGISESLRIGLCSLYILNLALELAAKVTVWADMAGEVS